VHLRTDRLLVLEPLRRGSRRAIRPPPPSVTAPTVGQCPPSSRPREHRGGDADPPRVGAEVDGRSTAHHRSFSPTFLRRSGRQIDATRRLTPPFTRGTPLPRHTRGALRAGYQRRGAARYPSPPARRCRAASNGSSQPAHGLTSRNGGGGPGPIRTVLPDIGRISIRPSLCLGSTSISL